MSNKTKRQVFEEMKWELIRNLANTIGQNGGLRPVEDATKVGENYATRYATALPDDLPTIPEVVDEFIRGWGYATLVMIFSQAKHLSTFAPTEREQLGWQWIVDNEDEFARAWIYGIWRVEETGEIVEL